MVHLCIGALLCVIYLPKPLNESPMSVKQQGIIKWWLKRCGRIINLHIQTVGQKTTKNDCFVANHISWLDIIVIGSVHPIRFLSKSEIARWPVIGYLACCAGTLFIQRGSGMRTAFDSIKRHLEQNETVALFPEGTTSSGYDIRRFHPRLFGAVIDAGVTVQPLAIGYTLNNKPDPNIPFSHRQSFLSNAVQVLKQPRIDATICYTDSVFETNREIFAKRTRALISQATKQIYEA